MNSRFEVVGAASAAPTGFAMAAAIRRRGIGGRIQPARAAETMFFRDQAGRFKKRLETSEALNL